LGSLVPEAEKPLYPRWLTLLAGRGREQYLLSLRYPLLVCLGMFTTSLLFGFVFSNRILGDLSDLLGELPSLEELGPPLFMSVLFINNALKTLVWMSLGLLFGIAPLFFIALNGFILGLVVHRLSQALGFFIVFIAIAPHGIVELPMTLLSAAVGVKLGYSLINRLRGQGSLIEELRKGLGLFLIRILPLLLAAAMIEAFITPLLSTFFLH